jgi:two-component system, sensor histidine kinase
MKFRRLFCLLVARGMLEHGLEKRQTGFPRRSSGKNKSWRQESAMTRLRSKKPSTAKRTRRRPRRRSPRRGARANGAPLAAYAHDIRTALTGILALGELLASSSLGERERRWAAGVKGSAEHLAALTTLMVDAAKADAGALTLQQEAFRPRRLLAALAESLTARAETKALAATVTVADNLPDMLLGDAVRLRAALENLIDNAVKFTERGTVGLDVRVARAAGSRARLVFTVTDSGIGLKPAEIKRLFRPFAQANADIARRYGGAGLGLAVVKALARLMGGDLSVTSEFGRGSKFRFSAVLPIVSAAAAASSALRQPTAPPPRLAVLCVEDNPYGRVILNTILGELGHRADFVGSGEEAVGAMARGYDVILMDVTLPGIDGLEATRRIRTLGGAVASTPIVGISGRTASGDEAAARAAGMNFYLRKPVSPSSLSEALAAVLRKQRS